jgi:hypothetical protein
MKNKIIYYSAVVVYILTAIEYISGRIYALGEYVWCTKLMPEFIWNYYETAYYKEAGGIRFVFVLATFLILTAVFMLVIRKNFSKITMVLSGTVIIPPLLYVASGYTQNRIIITIVFAVSLIHIVLTTVFLVKNAHTDT